MKTQRVPVWINLFFAFGRGFRFVLCVIVLTLSIQQVSAQLYPVQATVQLVPPYSVYLSDYATPGNDRLRVILLQRDLTESSYQVRLSMSIFLNGNLIMRTSRAFNPPPFTLDPGIPTIVSGADLQPYLDSRNIDFVGYSRDQYERTKALPEGSYQITFTAYDYRRQDVTVSNAGTSFYYLVKNEPPMVNFPACGTQIPLRTPQQIVFSWLARNTASPNSAAETQYEFALYETRPVGRNPNDVVLSTQPVFKTTVDFTQLIYGPAEPLLLEGMQYVWRVRAIDINGKDAFKNNGYSEVCTFKYGGVDPNFDIGVVKGLQATGETEHRGKIWWTKGEYDSYKVNYKKTGDSFEWFTSDVTTEQLNKDNKTDGELKLFDLEPDTEYETRIQGKKSGILGNYTDIVKFRTPPLRVVQCGDATPLNNLTNSNPLRNALKGTIINADGIDLTLTDFISVGDGFYKGMGTVSLPYLGGAVFPVKFDRIFIDENRTLGEGRIDFITDGVATVLKDQVAVLQKNTATQTQKDNRAAWTGTDFYDKVFVYDIEIVSVTATATELTITDKSGTTTTNPDVITTLNANPDKAIIIQDKNGDQYVAQKDKTTGEVKVTKVEGGGLMTGDDGKMMSEKEIKDLRKLIYATLKEFKVAIEDYQASNKKTDNNGGKKSFSKINLALLMVNLPACFEEHTDQLDAIMIKIDMGIDSASSYSKSLVAKIIVGIVEDGVVNEDKIEPVTCNAIVEDVNSPTLNFITIPLKDNGITITYNGITGTLQAFGFNTSKIEIKFKVTKTESNPQSLGQSNIQNELDALFARAAVYVQDQLNGKEFIKSELEQWVWNKQEDIRKYLEGLITEITQSGLEDLVGLSDGESTALRNSIKKFKDEQGINPSVTVADGELFNLLKSQYESGKKTPNKDVHLVVDKSGKNYGFFYKNGFFSIPTQKTITRDGQTQTVQLNGSQSEIFAIRDQVIATAVTNDDIDGIGKINEPTLNIFEKGMWVIKVTKETLAEVKVPVPMWDKNQTGTYPFSLESITAGLGDGAVDELKSIPDLLVMGLSLFDKQDRDALIKAVSSMNLETLKGMFTDKIGKYTQGGDVAKHEGGYDAVQVASMFWGGGAIKGKKAADKADEVLGVLQKLSQDVKDKMVQLTTKQRNAILRDLGGSPELLQKMTAELVDSWEILYNSGLESLRKNANKLDELSAVLKKNNLDFTKGGLTEFLKKSWDDPEAVVTALKKASDIDIKGLTVGYKKFPQPKDGSYSYVLDQAKKYQGKASGDANLSFNFNGVSFDNLVDGKLIDSKFGHATSIFKETDELYSEIPGLDDFVEQAGRIDITNKTRVQSIIDQATRQLNAVKGTTVKLQWEISTDLGARGIKQVFDTQGVIDSAFKNITVVFKEL